MKFAILILMNRISLLIKIRKRTDEKRIFFYYSHILLSYMCKWDIAMSSDRNRKL